MKPFKKIKEFVKSKFTFLKKYDDLWTIPVGLIVYWAFGLVAKVFGLNVYGAGVFQKLILGLVFLLIILGLVRFVIIIYFPHLHRYIDPDLKENAGWKNLEEKEKTYVTLGLFALFLFCLTTLVANL